MIFPVIAGAYIRAEECLDPEFIKISDPLDAAFRGIIKAPLITLDDPASLLRELPRIGSLYVRAAFQGIDQPLDHIPVTGNRVLCHEYNVIRLRMCCPQIPCRSMIERTLRNMKDLCIGYSFRDGRIPLCFIRIDDQDMTDRTRLKQEPPKKLSYLRAGPVSRNDHIDQRMSHICSPHTEIKFDEKKKYRKLRRAVRTVLFFHFLL